MDTLLWMVSATVLLWFAMEARDNVLKVSWTLGQRQPTVGLWGNAISRLAAAICFVGSAFCFFSGLL